MLSLSAVARKLNEKKRKHCYVILGYDLIIDENFKVWLLEINKNTGLQISSPIIEELIPRMIDDTFKLTLDKIFGFEMESSDLPVKGFNDENMWWSGK